MSSCTKQFYKYVKLFEHYYVKTKYNTPCNSYIKGGYKVHVYDPSLVKRKKITVRVYT